MSQTIFINPYQTYDNGLATNDIPWQFRAEESKLFNCDQIDYFSLYQFYWSSSAEMSNYINVDGYIFAIAFFLTLNTRWIGKYVLDYNR